MRRPTTIAALAALLAASPARAVGPLAFEVETLEGEIAVLRAKVRVFEALAERRVAAHQAWKEWWQKVQKILGQAKEDAGKKWATRQQKAAKVKALVDSLQDGPPTNVWVPGYRWVDPEKGLELLARMREEKAAYEKLLAEAKDKWWLVAVGWVTSGEVQARIDGLDEEVRKVREAVKDGSMKVWFQAHSWERLRDLREAIAGLEARIEALKKAAQEGTFAVVVPGYGKTTRNELDEAIAAEEAWIQARKQEHTRGEYRLHRMVYPDTLTEQKLDALLAEDAESYQAMQQLVGKGLYQVWFKDEGDETRTKFEEQLVALDKEIAEVQKQVAAGTYKVWAFGTEGTQKSLEEALERLRLEVAKPDLKEEARKGAVERLETLRKLLAAIPTVSAFELFRLGLEKATVTSNIAMILKLAEPDVAKRKLKRDLWTGWRTEFGHALAYDLAPREAKLERLQRIRQVYFAE